MARYTVYNLSNKEQQFTSKKMNTEVAIETIENMSETMVLNGWTIMQELSHYTNKHQYGIRLAKLTGNHIDETCHLFVSL